MSDAPALLVSSPSRVATRAGSAGPGGPVQGAPTGVEQPGTVPCPTDTDGTFALNWSYTPPGASAPLPVGFRVQQVTFSTTVLFDDAEEPLVASANSKWVGSPQWTFQVNPESGTLAYFIPDTAEQDEAFTLDPAVALPAGGASLSFLTNQDTEAGFDFFFVEISQNGGPFQTLGSFSGAFVGSRSFDVSPFAGGSVQVRFRMQSDLAVSAPGVFVEDVEITSDDFGTVAQLDPGLQP